MSVAGIWNITIKAPPGPMKATLELREENGALTGTQTIQDVSSEIGAAKYDGGSLSWTGQITKPMKMKLEFTGLVEGNSMSGKVKAGFMGKYDFTAVME